jgi:hypothetical protein
MDKISSALVKAQQAFGPALKTSTNPHFRSKYADLAACVEAVIDALNANGIAMTQRTHGCNDGVIVETIFIHESGEQISSGPFHVPAAKQDAQGYGSALTYARRYSLMAACGIAPEDDDGNSAADAAKRKIVANGSPGPRKIGASGADVNRMAFEALDPDTQNSVRRVCLDAVALVQEGNLRDAISLIRAQQDEHDDAAEISKAQWSLLDSATRRKIKEAEAQS